MSPEQVAIYKAHTGRDGLRMVQAREAWWICGRRAGKSFIVSLVAVFLGTFRDYRQFLAPGEKATIAILARDRRQARLLTEVPMLARLVERQTADTFDLTNSVTIEVGTASHASTRGYTYAAVLCDELAFWEAGDDDSELSAEAILTAVRPGIMTIPGAMLLCASSPYSKRGPLWNA